jgi:cytochrome b
MSTVATAAGAEPAIRVWDPIVRLFHWTIVLGYGINMWVTEDGSDAHEVIGYVVLAAIAIRLVWGFIGSRHARFADFIPGPSRLAGYLRQWAKRREPRYIGHNPLGAIMMLALIALMLSVGVTGWMMTLDAYWGEEWLEELHETLANAIWPLAGLHVLGAVIESFRHRENLIASMITGRKRAPEGTDVDHTPHASDPGRGQ